MSSEPGATAIAADAPLPRDAAGAATMREQLMADAEYTKAAASGDESKYTTLGYLRWVAAGQDPDRWGKPPETDADIYAQQGVRGAQLAEQHDTALRQHVDLSDEERHVIVHRRPHFQADKDRIAEEHARNLRDETFRERLNKRERGAVRDEYIANAIKSAPLARSQADIDAWIAAHPFTPRSG